MNVGAKFWVLQAIALLWADAALAQDGGFVTRREGAAGAVLIVRGVETRVLNAGDPIFEGDRIYTLSGGTVTLSHGGCEVDVGSNSSFVVDGQFCAQAPVTLAPSAIGEVRLSDGPEGSLLVQRDAQTFSLYQGDVLFNGDKVFTRSNGAAVIEAHGCDMQVSSSSAITIDEDVCQRRPVLLAANDRIGGVPITERGGVPRGMRVSASPSLLAGLGIGAGVGAAAGSGGGGTSANNVGNPQVGDGSSGGDDDGSSGGDDDGSSGGDDDGSSGGDDDGSSGGGDDGSSGGGDDGSSGGDDDGSSGGGDDGSSGGGDDGSSGGDDDGSSGGGDDGSSGGGDDDGAGPNPPTPPVPVSP